MLLDYNVSGISADILLSLIRVLVANGAGVNDTGPNLSTALHKAAAVGNLQAAELLVELGADKTMVDDRGFSPFLVALQAGFKQVALLLAPMSAHEAVVSQKIDTLRLLIANGCNLNEPGPHGKSLVQEAFNMVQSKDHKTVENGLAILKLLVSSGASVSPGFILHQAAADLMADVLEIVLQARDVDPNQRNAIGLTPLHCINYASTNKELLVATIKLLTVRGANPNVPNPTGNTALHFAAKAASLEGCQTLIEFGAVDGRRLDMTMARDLAVESGASEQLVKMLASSQPPEITVTLSRMWMMYAPESQMNLVDPSDNELSDLKDEKSPGSPNDVSGREVTDSPLDEARPGTAPRKSSGQEYSSPRIVVTSNPEKPRTDSRRGTQTNSEFTPIIITTPAGEVTSEPRGGSQRNSTTQPQSQSQSQSQPQSQGQGQGQGQTQGQKQSQSQAEEAMQQQSASRSGISPESTSSLDGANANKSDKNLANGTISPSQGRISHAGHRRVDVKMGDTPEVHKAIYAHNAAKVKLILEGNPYAGEIIDEAGRPALHTALQTENLSIATMFLEKGCNPNIMNADGKTPLHVMVMQGNKPAVELLLAHGADPNIKDSLGQTALALARFYEHPDLVERLTPENPVAVFFDKVYGSREAWRYTTRAPKPDPVFLRVALSSAITNKEPVATTSDPKGITAGYGALSSAAVRRLVPPEGISSPGNHFVPKPPPLPPIGDADDPAALTSAKIGASELASLDRAQQGTQRFNKGQTHRQVQQNRIVDRRRNHAVSTKALYDLPDILRTGSYNPRGSNKPDTIGGASTKMDTVRGGGFGEDDPKESEDGEPGSNAEREPGDGKAKESDPQQGPAVMIRQYISNIDLPPPSHSKRVLHGYSITKLTPYYAERAPLTPSELYKKRVGK